MLIDVSRFMNIQTYGMIKTIIRVMSAAFISFVLISFVLVGWTTYSFIFESSKSIEIGKIIQDMYLSQKSFFVDIIDLSKILTKDSISENSNKNENVFLETEFLADKDEASHLDKSPSTEDNGDNPLGIVIEPSLPDVNENILSQTIEEPLDNEQNDLSISEKEK